MHCCLPRVYLYKKDFACLKLKKSPSFTFKMLNIELNIKFIL